MEVPSDDDDYRSDIDQLPADAENLERARIIVIIIMIISLVAAFVPAAASLLPRPSALISPFDLCVRQGSPARSAICRV